MRKTFIIIVALLAGAGFFGLWAAGTYAEGPDCAGCHPKIAGGKVVHKAVGMGCVSCHGGIDASSVPHKSSSKAPKGLNSETPELCYGCHAPSAFDSTTIHAPVGVGMCLNCHNPHSSDNPKLLTLPGADLCFTCHNKADYAGKKSVHMPVETGLCLQCHAPHAKNNENLLLKKGNILCRQCHANIEREAHGVVSFSEAGHPVMGRMDPVRKGKTFGCISCHLPHASDYKALFRYKGETFFDTCFNCHPNN